MAYPEQSVDSHERTFSAIDGEAVTPSDSEDLGIEFSRGIYVGGAGNLKVTLVGGTDVTFTSLAAGVIHPIAARRIWSTGTTATSIVALK